MGVDREFEESRILSDLLRAEHVRYNDFCRICLTANAILLGFGGWTIRDANPRVWLPLLIAGTGITICVFWILPLCRLREDSRRRK